MPDLNDVFGEQTVANVSSATAIAGDISEGSNAHVWNSNSRATDTNTIVRIRNDRSRIQDVYRDVFAMLPTHYQIWACKGAPAPQDC